jgi:hypothetical protein
MPDQMSEADRSRWLLQPPAAGEIQIRIAVGEGAELTPQVQAALEQFMGTLQQADVAGFADTCAPRCPMLKECSGFGCTGYHNCTFLSSSPCVADVFCRIRTVTF